MATTWERALVINAQLFLRSTATDASLMSLSDLRLAVISYYLQEPMVDMLAVISKYTDETFFDMFESSAFYHWGLFYSETNLSLQFSALLFSLGSTKLEVLGKLRDNLEYFIFNTPFERYPVLLWPTLYRHVLSCLKSTSESSHDQERVLSLLNKVNHRMSPFWKATFHELLEKHGLVGENVVQLGGMTDRG